MQRHLHCRLGGIRRRIALVLTLAAAAAAVLLSSPAGGAAPAHRGAGGAQAAAVRRVPGDFVGVVSDDALAPSASPLYRDRTLANEHAIGVQLIRTTFDWASIERRPGVYDFTATDAVVAAAAAHRLRLLPILFDPPAFDSARPRSRPRPGTYPPRDDATMARFAVAALRRYGVRGTFWSSHPTLPALPVHSWQVWNEPNLPAYWASGPDTAGYAAMLRAVGNALHGADPQAEVVTAGIPDSRLGTPYLEYIGALLRSGVRGSFDTLALNPYAATSSALVTKLHAVRRLLDHYHYSHTPTWISEIGWANGGGGASAQRVSTTAQAHLVAAAVTTLGALRKRLRIRGFVYFAWKDSRPYPPAYRDLWGLHTGLLALNGRPKPAYASFVRAIGRLEKG